ncbi:MAG: hypothetical protein LBJ44_00790 [Propionibacteriaceae bacterium]|nr:hypothetical protein [Propionibacteriaceae bacterium]
MKNKSLPISLVVTIVLLGLAGCGASSGQFEQPASTPLPVRVAYADLASGATSVEELATQSQLAILATAGGANQEPNKVDPTIVATIQSFSTDKVVWGKDPGRYFEVKFTGGVVSDDLDRPYILQLDGQPQFNEGQQYFLILLGPSPDGTYMVLGGPQGRYEVIDGRLRAVKGTEADPVIARLDGAEFNAVTQELTHLIP